MSRDMTNSEAISNLNHIYGIVSPDIQRSLDVAFEALEQQLKCGCNTCEYYPRKEERPQGEWISVSEKLPDKNISCLVSVGKFNFTQIAMYSDLMGTINHKIFWQGDYGKNNFQNITEYVNAWMPLPEPYKKGGAE